MQKEPDIAGIIAEFLEVAIHNIIYIRKIYPEGIFTLKKKYNVPIHVSMFPDINSYITESLLTVKHLINQEEMKQVDVCFYNQFHKPVERFVFNFDKIFLGKDMRKESDDPNLMKLKECFRAFCLKLPVCVANMRDLPKGSTFKINIHTTERGSVLLSENPSFADFPWVEAEREEIALEDSVIQPIRKLETDNLNIEIFAENNY